MDAGLRYAQSSVAPPAAGAGSSTLYAGMDFDDPEQGSRPRGFSCPDSMRISPRIPYSDLFQELEIETIKAMSCTEFVSLRYEKEGAIHCVRSDWPKHSIVWIGKEKFLHANYITDEVGRRAFIASSYPQDASSFWEFVSHNDYSVIDISGLPCRYAPEEEGEEREISPVLSIKLIRTIFQTADEVFSEYKVRNGTDSFVVQRYSYKKWPCKGVITVSKLHDIVSMIDTKLSKNIFVHSRLGFGRTGTLLTAYFLKQKIVRKCSYISQIAAIVKDLILRCRMQRGLCFVENSEQFFLLLQYGQTIFDMSYPQMIAISSRNMHPSTGRGRAASSGELKRPTNVSITSRSIRFLQKKEEFGIPTVSKEMFVEERRSLASLEQKELFSLTREGRSEAINRVQACEIAQRFFSPRPIKCTWEGAPLVSFVCTEAVPESCLDAIFQEIPRAKIRYEPSTRTIHFGYGPFVIRSLVYKSPMLARFVGFRYRTIFDGYGSFYTRSVHIQLPHIDTGDLLKKAKIFFQVEKPCLKTPIFLPPYCSEEAMLLSCLEKYPGICIGEIHSEGSSKRFILEHLPLLVSLGVTTLFLEHMPSESLQEDVDMFMAVPHGTEMSVVLSTYLEDLSEKFLLADRQATYKQVIVAAKSAGIKKIVCIDTEETYGAGKNAREGCFDPIRRNIVFNYQAIQQIKAVCRQGKFIVFCGGAHLSTYENIPGIAEMTRAVSLYVTKAVSSYDVGVRMNEVIVGELFPSREKSRQFRFDVVVRRKD